MLQATEYDVRDYFAWYRRVADFRTVEKRKHLRMTPKAGVLVALAWALPVVVLIALLRLTNGWGLGSALMFALIAGIGVTYAIPYVLAGAVIALQTVQAPIELLLMRRVRESLRRHRALKIAIAGSYGKTSVREILKEVLSEGKKVAAAPGSFNTPLGTKAFVDSLDGDEDILIFELGEYYPGDVRTLAEIVAPSIGFITGVNEAHLEKFGSLEKTAATVFELADYLVGKTVYVNGENDRVRLDAREGHIVYTRDGVADWLVEDAATDLEGTRCTLHCGAVRIPVRSKLLGLHMIGPLAAAAHLAFELGYSVEQIERGLAATKPYPHRLAPRTDASGVVTLDDSYNGNPDGVAAIIDFLRTIKRRRTYVTPGLVEVGQRAERVHRAIGAQLASADIERVVLIRNSVTPYIADGLKDAHFTGELVWYEDALAAYAALPLMTVAGDVVVLQNDWPDQYA